MNKPRIAASVLSAAIGIALAAPAALAQGMPNPPPIVKENMQRMAQQHLEKCYGVNAVAKERAAPRARIPAPARRRSPAIRNHSCSCPLETARRSPAAGLTAS